MSKSPGKCVHGCACDRCYVNDSDTSSQELLRAFMQSDAGLVTQPVVLGTEALSTVDVTLRSTHEFASAPQSGDPVLHTLIELEARGPGLMAGRAGPVAHVILALDVSASMNRPDKYPVLIDALRGMLIDLQDPDSPEVLISVVAFAYGAATILRDVSARTLDPRELERLLDESPLRFTRYTDVAGAMTRAGRIALDSHRANRRLPLQIVVLTDGRPQDIVRATAAIQKLERLPVDVHGLAFGEDADVAALKRLLCGRRGGTVKLVDEHSIGEVFERIAEVSQRLVAKRALVDVELVGGVVGGAAHRHRPARHAFGDTSFANGVHFHTDLGTLERERTYSLLLQLRLPATTADETEIGRVTLRVPGEGGPLTFEHTLSIPRHAGSESPSPEPIVKGAVDIVAGADSVDVLKVLTALRARRQILAAEHRSDRLVSILDHAIHLASTEGSLNGLSAAEWSALSAHTRTVVHSSGALAHQG